MWDITFNSMYKSLNIFQPDQINKIDQWPRDRSPIRCNQWHSPKLCSTLRVCECTLCPVVVWFVLRLTFTERREVHVYGRSSFAVFSWWDWWQYVSVDSPSFWPSSSALEYSHPCCLSNGRLCLRLPCALSWLAWWRIRLQLGRETIGSENSCCIDNCL